MLGNRAAAALAAVVAVLVASCGPARPLAATADGKPRVVATTTIVADLVRQVAGEAVAIETLMGPGVDPHSYRPTPRDADRLVRADLVVASGLHLEGRLQSLLERLGRRKPVIFVAEGLPENDLLEAEAGLPDPHVWFDASLWARCVPGVVAALERIAPELSEDFHRRGDDYRERLESLHGSLRARLAAVPASRRVLVTAHDAFRYYGRAYSIEVVGVQGVSTESEAGLADVNRLVDLVVDRSIPAVFVETSVPDRSVRAILEGAAARGHAVTTGGRLYSDALGPPGSDGDTLTAALEANTQRIATALGGDPEGPRR